MSYRLKKNVQSFTVVDGPLAKRTYRQGMVYEEIPANEAAKFEKVKPAETDSAAAKTGRKTVENGARKEEAK